MENKIHETYNVILREVLTMLEIDALVIDEEDAMQEAWVGMLEVFNKIEIDMYDLDRTLPSNFNTRLWSDVTHTIECRLKGYPTANPTHSLGIECIEFMGINWLLPKVKETNWFTVPQCSTLEIDYNVSLKDVVDPQRLEFDYTFIPAVMSKLTDTEQTVFGWKMKDAKDRYGFDLMGYLTYEGMKRVEGRIYDAIKLVANEMNVTVKYLLFK